MTILITSKVYPIDGTIAEKEDTMKRPRTINKPLRVIRSIEELPVICDAAEVGLLLRKKPETVSKMAHDGVLPGVKDGSRWYFRRDDLVAYIEKMFTRPTALPEEAIRP